MTQFSQIKVLIAHGDPLIAAGLAAAEIAPILWNQRATYFWLATYADRILRGEKPAILPVVQPTRFELAVNLGTARLLGIDLDQSSILFRANRVIE